MKTTEKIYKIRFSNFEYIGFAGIVALLLTIVVGVVAG